MGWNLSLFFLSHSPFGLSRFKNKTKNKNETFYILKINHVITDFFVVAKFELTNFPPPQGGKEKAGLGRGREME